MITDLSWYVKIPVCKTSMLYLFKLCKVSNLRQNRLSINQKFITYDNVTGEKKVITTGWKDEGFRNSKDPSIDWKEQLNYRIVQMISDGKETLLYYGCEY